MGSSGGRGASSYFNKNSGPLGSGGLPSIGSKGSPGLGGPQL